MLIPCHTLISPLVINNAFYLYSDVIFVYNYLADHIVSFLRYLNSMNFVGIDRFVKFKSSK